MTTTTTDTITIKGSGAVVCCGRHRARCLFGRPHTWVTWYENGQLVRTADTYHCYDCGGSCVAEESTVAAEVAAADTVTLTQAATVLAQKTDKTADDLELEAAIGAELARRQVPPTHCDNGAYGTVRVGADADGHGGYVRGIATFNGAAYMALTGAASKPFKTLAGAVRWMEKRGYDAHGRRI